ncbi:MAG TPA: ShlB/FhaC/HecB family hemolysin secretion/activation protein [Gemmatimonadaceae bacterium]
MFVVLSVALALTQQPQIGPPQRRLPTVRDSVGDTTKAAATIRHRGVRRAVTAEDQRTAFKDATARATLLRARVARLTQDSALISYDAMSYSRISAGMGFTRIGRDRLLFRQENAARVRWQQGVGVWIDVRGHRSVFPMVGSDDAKEEMKDEMNDPDMNAAIPYFPGYEPLWVGNGMARAQVDESEIVNPIADGAEAYYTYSTGDSVSFKLPNAAVIQLREVKIRPREPKWNLAVGSLWFDTRSGQLVRAAYRLSVPIDIWAVAKADDPKSMDDVPRWVKPMITPMKAEVTAIAVEYSLHEGRFWLPRLRLAEGSAQVSFMHVPFKMEESFTYASVNGKDSLPPISVATNEPRPRMPDSLTADQERLWRDSVRTARRAHVAAVADSVHRGLRTAENHRVQCDTADTRVTTSTRYGSELRIAMRIPCDESKLEKSPDLPHSIYDPGDELFGAKDLDALKAEALSLGVQAPMTLRLSALPPPSVAYGPSMMRYNRVEGLSLGGSIEQEVGGGYSGRAVARIGLADHEPNVELTAMRTNLSESIHLSGYNHLVSASDWGHPLSFGSSFSALMFGRDEGFYYRASGVEVGGDRQTSIGGGARLDWRAFVEEQRTAGVRTNFAVDGADFPPNLVARRGTYVGVAGRVNHDYGLDPAGLRVLTDLRFEAASGDSLYGRAALDLTVSHGLGPLAGALTLSGGSSVGGLPPQRMWYLGGSQTVRGQSPDTSQSGNAFWLSRAELGANDAGIRPAVFADLGWVGDRTKLSQVGRPLSGVGAGVSFLDGLFRFDVARGINPRKQYRLDLYLESKF